ncbi:MAG TPA: hybrid sensor histidine kinase/response regulator [Lachnospiraceae bacterium]|nr:hybrid sensor histidine kinase/response regulator [Lachnospiraceae bacterium]
MIKNTKKFLLISFSILISVCIVMFTITSVYVSGKSDGAINEIGMIYMSAIAKQMQEKFDAVIDSQILEMEGIVERHPPETMVYGPEMIEQLVLSAQVRDFLYLGLYTKDGDCEVIYGKEVEYKSEEVFHNVLQDSSLRVFSGLNVEGERVMCLLIDVAYPMKEGKISTAMVAAMPMEYLENVLALDGENSLMYSYIIRRDGTFVIRTNNESLFENINETFCEFKGKQPEEYINELREAINQNTDYATIACVNQDKRYLLCTDLPNSEWYLISLMPFGILDRILKDLSIDRQTATLLMCFVIIGGIVIIFLLYYRVSKQQLLELENARKDAVKANKAKSEFLSSMSHDIRTPMNGIVGMTAIAMANIDNPERVKDCLAKITLSSRHLLGLINDVLDMSKIESGKLTLNMNQLSLRETMDSIVNIVQPQVKERQQHFDIFIQKVITEEVHCDSVRLNQILINLLSNALKFTPEGGRINVYLRQEPSPVGEDYVRCHFRVKDNGVGMTEEFQKKIFDTFTREEKAQVDKIEGTGLGMAITKAIVDTMKGSIEVQSAPGKGTEFHITLDLEKADVKVEDMKLPPWRMLVVDNNEELCQSAALSLKEIGIDAQWVADGKTAVEVAKKCHNEQNSFEIVLLDWKMPGMDGLHTAREMRKHLGENVPILIISAYDWSEIEDEATEAGIQGFISKPLFKSNLFLGLRRYMLDESAKEEKEESKIHNSFFGKRILLAEDNDLNWEIAEDLLSEVGFELDRAENGKMCIEKFEQSAQGYYDVVLMDIRMPIMNGYDAAKGIRALARPDAKLPIIAMTADAFSDDIQRCLDCGMNEHVAKPIDVNRLTQILKKYL